MSNKLKSHASLIFGLFGGIIGLLWSYAILSLDGSDCSCGWPLFQATFAWPMVVGSIVGLLGAGVYAFARRTGGTLLMAGGVITSPILFFLLSGSLLNPGLLLSGIGFILAPGAIAGLLIFLGGLLSFHKTRRIIKNLHDGGWIP